MAYALNRRRRLPPAARALNGLGHLRRGLGNVNTSGMIDNYDGTFTDPVTGNVYSTGGNPIDPSTGLPVTGTLTPAATPAASSAGSPLIQSSYLDAQGNTIIPLQGGGYRMISATTGNPSQFDTAPPPPGTGFSAAQTAAAIAKATQWSGPANPYAYQPVSQTFSGWLSANSTTVAIGAGLLLFVVLLGGRR